MSLNRPILLMTCWLLIQMAAHAQDKPAKAAPGIITGNVIDPQQKAVAAATVTLRPFNDSITQRSALTDKNGNFEFDKLPFGYYKLTVSFVSFRLLTIDSIHIRAERFDFNLNDLSLKPNTDTALEEVVVYAEKPLIESRDGNITFNAGESALSAGSSAAELLRNVPLVANDPDGKIVVRGKEPKILIDDKPVELNAQQLADLLESLPGSMIEKIEVLTNPPPQYANEQGGVINIVTKKGKVGVGARLTLTAGTRGEYGASGNINYRKKGLAVNFNTGFALNEFDSHGQSMRQTNRADSSFYYKTENNGTNRGFRPNARLSVDYEFDKRNTLNAVINYNQAITRNHTDYDFTNINRFKEPYWIRDRLIETEGENVNTGINLTYTRKGKKPGTTLRFIGGTNITKTSSDRTFYEQFLLGDRTPTGLDSTQQQLNDTRNNGYNLRVNYDKLLDNKKTTFTIGGAFISDNNQIDLVTQRMAGEPEPAMVVVDSLSTEFSFRQQVSNLRIAVKQLLGERFSITGGVAMENTDIQFELKDKSRPGNRYLSWLPFMTLSKKWEEVLNVNLSYRKAVRRPGINQLNPALDITDPNNDKYGNPSLLPSFSHNLDLVFGRTTDNYFTNLGFGYNLVSNIISSFRSDARGPSGKTLVTFINIDDKHEYEISTWNGYTFSKALRLNLSASYSMNRYSLTDREERGFRNGATFTSNFNGNYLPTDVWNITTGITYNRFANAQGSVRSNMRMNFGVQRKLFKKKLVVTLNVVDPLVKQEFRSTTYGSNYLLESFSSTNTRNYRLTIAYNFTQLGKKKQAASKPGATAAKTISNATKPGIATKPGKGAAKAKQLAGQP